MLYLPLVLSAATAAGSLRLAGVLPTGQYSYAIKSEGKVSATSVVTITRGASSVIVEERFDKDGQVLETRRALDPSTFATLCWAAFGEPPNDLVTITAKGATHVDRAKKASEVMAPAVIGAPSTVFDFLGAEFVTLPAMIYATGVSRYNEYCVCFSGLQVAAVAVVPVPAANPSDGHAGDAAIAVRLENQTITLWYDPRTFVLRELDFPSEQIQYVRLA